MDEVLKIEHFKSHVGKIVRFKGTRFALSLDNIIPGHNQQKGPTREAFTLIFSGPKEQEHLPEGLYECEVERGPTYKIYVSPVHTPTLDRQDYQAVFN